MLTKSEWFGVTFIILLPFILYVIIAIARQI